jgi:hypothetical protein
VSKKEEKKDNVEKKERANEINKIRCKGRQCSSISNQLACSLVSMRFELWCERRNYYIISSFLVTRYQFLEWIRPLTFEAYVYWTAVLIKTYIWFIEGKKWTKWTAVSNKFSDSLSLSLFSSQSVSHLSLLQLQLNCYIMFVIMLSRESEL